MRLTVESIIRAALRQIGVLGQDEPMEAEQARDALDALRRMIDAWSLENLMIPFRATEVFPASGLSLYRMGPDGDWDTIRPETIDALRYRDSTGSMRALTRSSIEIEMHRARLDAGTPTRYLLSLDPTFALIEFNAVASEGEFLITTTKPLDASVLDDFDQLPEHAPETTGSGGFTLTGVQSEIKFPPGYERAIVANLAIEIAAEYGKQVPDTVAVIAIDSKRRIKARNSQPAELITDHGLRGRGGRYDILAGPV